MNKCKHKGYLDYKWLINELDHTQDRIIAVFCHNCGNRLK